MRAFQAYRSTLETVLKFKYLGQILTALDDNWTAVVGKLRKSRKIWDRFSRIMVREVASPRVLGKFFKAVVQAFLVFGSETWVVTPRIGRALG